MAGCIAHLKMQHLKINGYFYHNAFTVIIEILNF